MKVFKRLKSSDRKVNHSRWGHCAWAESGTCLQSSSRILWYAQKRIATAFVELATSKATTLQFTKDWCLHCVCEASKVAYFHLTPQMHSVLVVPLHTVYSTSFLLPTPLLYLTSAMTWVIACLAKALELNLLTQRPILDNVQRARDWNTQS